MCFLIVIGFFQCSDNQPGALSILDISSNLPRQSWITETVQIVVLNLEHVAHGQEYFFGLFIQTRIIDTMQNHPQLDGKIKRIVRSFVLNGLDVSVHCEVL